MEKAIAFDYSPAKDSLLGITSVGRSDTMAGHCFGPAVRPYYLIHYILAGSGTFRVNGIDYHLHSGQGFFIEPNYQTYYFADELTPWSYVWLGFVGDYATALIKQLAISEQSPIFNNDHYYELADCVNQIIQHPLTSPAAELRANSNLLRFLSLIADSTVVSDYQSAQQNPYVDRAISYLAQHVATASADQLAQVVNLDRSYLSTLFKRATDLTPGQYIRNFRITKARHLLESSSLPIEEVAQQCGYDHANSFTRIFKRIYGITPREYRKQVRNQNSK
ncbi:MAG: AraC family transcriptional regulator [Limosilactobacillus pontis]|uniref:AraC family transcriptional regulator n=1 Tax=Limosilactobacillus pontis TaxID=35787 RepID=A0A2J6NLL8_9LACO|nr:AraC family transcriptional regulator [Limosilactobacillus pontis]PMB82217.1 AraC family transcriptional regulator [Limosilactobacillus pontis]